VRIYAYDLKLCFTSSNSLSNAEILYLYLPAAIQGTLRLKEPVVVVVVVVVVAVELLVSVVPKCAI